MTKRQSEPEQRMSQVLPEPNARERAAIEQAKRRVGERSPRVTVSICQNEGAKVDLRGGHCDHQGWLARIEDAFGSRGTEFAVSQLNQLMTASQDGTGKVDGSRLNAMLAMIEGVRPQNEMQAALAV